MEKLYFRPKKLEPEVQTKIKIKERRSEGSNLTNKTIIEESYKMEEESQPRKPIKNETSKNDIKERFKAFRGIKGDSK